MGGGMGVVGDGHGGDGGCGRYCGSLLSLLVCCVFHKDVLASLRIISNPWTRKPS